MATNDKSTGGKVAKADKPKRVRATPRTAERTGRVGYPRAYSAREFADAVDGYFASISYDDVARDDGGRPIKSRAGGQIGRVRYAVPPSKQALCLYLGISRDTYAEYARREDYKAVCDRVTTEVEAYLATELDEREARGRRVDGVKFNLMSNYGWRDRREVEIGEETRESATATVLTLSQRAQILREAAGEFAETVDTDGDGRGRTATDGADER